MEGRAMAEGFTVFRSAETVLIRAYGGAIEITHEEAARLATELGPPAAQLKKGRRRFAPEETAELTRAYLAGEAIRSIAARLGRSRGAISSKINQLGIADRNPVVAERMRQRYAARRAA
jgi:hypothetical protein